MENKETMIEKIGIYNQLKKEFEELVYGIHFEATKYKLAYGSVDYFYIEEEIIVYSSDLEGDNYVEKYPIELLWTDYIKYLEDKAEDKRLKDSILKDTVRRLEEQKEREEYERLKAKFENQG